MRVLHLYAGNLFGGIETLLVTLARYRDLCPEMEPHFGLSFAGRLREELLSTGVPVSVLGQVRLSRPWTVRKARRQLGELLRRQRFDAVICHSCWPHVVFAPEVRAQGTALVFWAHDLMSGRHWLHRWARWTPPDLLLANSRCTASSVARLFPEVPRAVQYLPVPALDSENRDEVRTEVRRALGTPDQAVVIVLACRLERWKGHSLLLEALAELRALPHWECWLAGGVQRPHEQTYLEELQGVVCRKGLRGRVRFLGQRSDVARLLTAADIYCQPNTRPEPFGLALVEALAAGLALVTTALGGALEIVNDTCGVLLPLRQPEAVAEALRRLILDPVYRARLGVRGRLQARRLCDPGLQMNKLAAVLASTFSEPRPRGSGADPLPRGRGSEILRRGL